METFKDSFYGFLKNEIDRHEKEGTGKAPFLYLYLKQKKEEDPRLVVLTAYLQYLQGGCADPRAVISAAAESLRGACHGAELPSGLKRLTAILLQKGTANSASEAMALLSDAEKRERFLQSAEADLFSPSLCRQLAEDVRAAFPYNEKRNDRYVQLREQDLLFQCEEHPDGRNYFLFLLEFTISYVRPVTQRTFGLFFSLWKGIQAAVPSLSEKKLPPHGKNNLFRERLEAIRGFAEEGMRDIPPEAIPRDVLHALTEQLLRTLIKTDAAAWMYDVGYPIHERQEGTRAPRRPRKADRTMDLLDSFYRERGEEFGDRSGTKFDFDESRVDIEALFTLLDQGKRRDVIIPIAIDCATGAGLYIVGNDLLKNSTEPKGFDKYYREHNCSYNVMYPSDIRYADDNECGIFQTMNYYRRYQIWLNALEDAYNYYSAIIDLMNSSDHAGFAYDFYRVDINGRAPEGCPRAYLKYFEEDLDTEEDDLIDLIGTPGFKPGKMNASSSYRF